MANTAIQWADKVWNPVSGCSKVSAGCANCYAETYAHRFWGDRKFTDVQCHEDRLDQPLHWKKPRRIFVNSMSDLFHEDVPDKFIGAVWDAMVECPEHTFLILTKRPARMQYYCALWAAAGSIPHDHIHLGVSVEDQATADERIPLLLQTPAAVRFVSIEPMLESVEMHFQGWLGHSWNRDRRVDWVICGGESGPGCRHFDPDWARKVLSDCRTAEIPFFFKQMSGLHPKQVAIPEDLQIQEFPNQ